MTLGLVLGPTLIGHSLMNRAMTKLPPQTVSLFNLAQFIVAGVMAFFLFKEVPGPEFALASALIAIGVLIPILKGARHG
jgi:drug/metabolite transporter (DMT)-like permease